MRILFKDGDTMTRGQYTRMTMHRGRGPSQKKTAVGTRTPPNVPEVGQRLKLDPDLVVQEERDGVQQTPMTKIRFFADAWEWKQVPRHEAGMFIFFNNEPQMTHKAFVITSLIPSNTAGYANLE